MGKPVSHELSCHLNGQMIWNHALRIIFSGA
ncbi:BnaA07g07680D [Brassica napus]|uniref:BnaA07g07680D protein n=1 Tax=Brassica napus TaxID=3708 RepID=A0A078I036_BRANA|nr:BnaA07g07680D [Brassica napus]